MKSTSPKIPSMACRDSSRRAMSLLELTLVLVLVGIISLSAVTRYGSGSLGNGGAEGYARKLALSLGYARRSAIATGDNHHLQLTSSGGSISSFTLMRTIGSGTTQVDQTFTVPDDVTVTSSSSTLEFDFEGSALAAYSITVAGPNRTWTVSVIMLTGAVQVTESP